MTQKIQGAETPQEIEHVPGQCPMDPLLRAVSGRWTLYILWLLRSAGPQRFGALKTLIPGISAKMLTERLRGLETAGLITREVVATIPPQVTYSLSCRGAELHRALDGLHQVAEKWQGEGWTLENGPKG
ncbi:winged helix-turn-helix transcriptional regulator [Roseovarius sp. C7]|uniref:winged helix-turn-helix transcriptional regulator n=1 Tax=Roseovarius sp. C7 TaxID=3398643 RepID=UPI0039F6D374